MCRCVPVLLAMRSLQLSAIETETVPSLATRCRDQRPCLVALMAQSQMQSALPRIGSSLSRSASHLRLSRPPRLYRHAGQLGAVLPHRDSAEPLCGHETHFQHARAYPAAREWFGVFPAFAQYRSGAYAFHLSPAPQIIATRNWFFPAGAQTFRPHGHPGDAATIITSNVASPGLCNSADGLLPRSTF